MNHPSQFARLSPGAAAKAGRHGLLPRSLPAPFNHDQILTHGSGRGVPTEPGKLGSHASIPVRVFFVRGQGFPDQLGRGRVALGPLGRPSGCVNTQLAKPINSAEHSRHDAVQPFKRHSKNSLRYGPEPSEGEKNAIHENHQFRSGEPNDR